MGDNQSLKKELQRQQKMRTLDARNNLYKNNYDSNSQWGYLILVIAIAVFVCTFCMHGMNQPQFNHNGQPDIYRNCQTPYFR